MPRPRKQIPEMRYHLSGQARVYLDGKYYYLGGHGSAVAQARFDTLVATYLANNRRMPNDEPTHQAESVITVQNITAEYRRLSIPIKATRCVFPMAPKTWSSPGTCSSDA